jgi:hypothetical protein
MIGFMNKSTVTGKAPDLCKGGLQRKFCKVDGDNGHLIEMSFICWISCGVLNILSIESKPLPFNLPHMEYEGSIGLVSIKMKKKNYLFGLYIAKKLV